MRFYSDPTRGGGFFVFFPFLLFSLFFFFGMCEGSVEIIAPKIFMLESEERVPQAKSN